MLKLKMSALRDDVTAGRRRLHIKAGLSSQRVEPPPPAWIAGPTTAVNHRCTVFYPQRSDHYAKQLEGTRSIVNEQCRSRVAPIEWATHPDINGSKPHALP